MFPSLHHPLIDDLRRIVSSRVDMHTLFDHRIASSPQRLSCLVPTRLDLGLCYLPALRIGGHIEGEKVLRRKEGRHGLEKGQLLLHCEKESGW